MLFYFFFDAASVKARAVMQKAINDEERLIAELQAGDEDAFRRLVKEYNGFFKQVLRSFRISEADIEEVLQDAWLGVYRGIGRFEGRSSLKTWLFRIVTNTAKTQLKKSGRWQKVYDDTVNQVGGGLEVDPTLFGKMGFWRRDRMPADFPDPEQQAASREEVQEVEKLLQQLPENQRLVVYYRDVVGLPSEEICNLLEITESNQRVLLHRGRSAIRDGLEKFYSRGTAK